MSEPVNIRGYAPDLDSTTPGIMTSCLAIVPSMKGMKAAPSASDVGLDALSGACVGAAVARKLDASTRFFAGSATAIEENTSGSTWTDRTRAVGGAYTLGTDTRWRFAQFGDYSLAAAKSDTLQVSQSGAFADIAGAPKASIVETVGQFVMLLDTNEGTYGDSPDRWFCSGLGDHTVWTPAIATQCATGRLTSTSGPIRGGRRLGDSMVAYKDRAMFLGVYVGGALVWDWREVSDKVGAPCHEVIVPITTRGGGAAHIFLGYDDFYYYDGSRPIPIPNPVKKTILDAVNKSYFYRSWALHDGVNSIIYFFYVSTSSGEIDSCVAYNYRKDSWLDSWGRHDMTIEAAVEYVTAGITYDDLGTYYSTYNTNIPFSYDSPFWVNNYPSPAIFNTSHKVATLTGTPGSSTFTLADIGNDQDIVALTRARPRYLTAPTSATLQNAYKMLSGDSFTNDASTSLSNGVFDVIRSARWHRLTHAASGSMEIPHAKGMVLNMAPDGEE
jgi:hypothetical protein